MEIHIFFSHVITFKWNPINFYGNVIANMRAFPDFLAIVGEYLLQTPNFLSAHVDFYVPRSLWQRSALPQALDEQPGPHPRGRGGPLHGERAVAGAPWEDRLTVQAVLSRLLRTLRDVLKLLRTL